MTACGFSKPFSLPAIEFDEAGGVRDALTAVSPHKRGFWQRYGEEPLVISASPEGPMGLSPAQIEEKILKVDYGKAAEAVANRFQVELLCGEEAERSSSGRPVDLETFCGLYSIAATGKYDDAVLVSLFLAPASVFVFKAPRGHLLRDLLASSPAIADYLGTHPEEQPAHLLTNEVIPLDTPCSHHTALLYFPRAGSHLQSPGSWLFPFPAFNRRLSMQPGAFEKEESSPCTNCLACRQFCPSGLHPAFLHHHISSGDSDGALELGMSACIQCGWCSYVCPSRLPLAQTIVAGIDKINGEQSLDNAEQ